MPTPLNAFPLKHVLNSYDISDFLRDENPQYGLLADDAV
jgi:hypothetical protein